MEQPITTRLPVEFVLKIKEIAKKENLDTSAVIRRLLSFALVEENFKTVLEKLSLNKISIGKASQLLNISIWEMMDIAKKNNINWTAYDKEELENELKYIKIK